MLKHSIYKNACEIVYNKIIITGRIDFRYIKTGTFPLASPFFELSDSCYRMIYP